MPCPRPCCFSSSERAISKAAVSFLLKCRYRQLELTSLLKECVHLHRANGISAHRRVKDILQEKANITNPLAWVRNNNKSVLYLYKTTCCVYQPTREKILPIYLYLPKALTSDTFAFTEREKRRNILTVKCMSRRKNRVIFSGAHKLIPHVGYICVRYHITFFPLPQHARSTPV